MIGLPSLRVVLEALGSDPSPPEAALNDESRLQPPGFPEPSPPLEKSNWFRWFQEKSYNANTWAAMLGYYVADQLRRITYEPNNTEYLNLFMMEQGFPFVGYGEVGNPGVTQNTLIRVQTTHHLVRRQWGQELERRFYSAKSNWYLGIIRSICRMFAKPQDGGGKLRYTFTASTNVYEIIEKLAKLNNGYSQIKYGPGMSLQPWSDSAAGITAIESDIHTLLLDLPEVNTPHRHNYSTVGVNRDNWVTNQMLHAALNAVHGAAYVYSMSIPGQWDKYRRADTATTYRQGDKTGAQLAMLACAIGLTACIQDNPGMPDKYLQSPGLFVETFADLLRADVIGEAEHHLLTPQAALIAPQETYPINLATEIAQRLNPSLHPTEQTVRLIRAMDIVDEIIHSPVN